MDKPADDERFVVEYIDVRTYIASEYGAAVEKHIFYIWMTANDKKVGLSNYNQSIFRFQFDRKARTVNDSLVVTASATAGDDLTAHTGYIVSNRYFKADWAKWQAVSQAKFSLAEPAPKGPTPDVVIDKQLGFDLAGNLTKSFDTRGWTFFIIGQSKYWAGN